MKKFIQKGVLEGNEQYAKILLSKKIYSLPTIYAAAYVYLDKAYLILDDEDKNGIGVYVFAKENRDPEKIAKDFYNELINYAHYFNRVENNAATIKTIMQRVLFSVNPKFAEEAEELEIQQLLKDLEKEEPAKKTR